MPRKPKELIIDDSTNNDLIFKPIIDGEKKGRGYVERDYEVYPEAMFAPPSALKLIDESEWPDRIKEMEDTKSRCSDIRMTGNKGKMIPSYDQDGIGYCWNHSLASTVTVVRAVMHLPYVEFSPFAIGAIIKKGKDEGGWCGLSAEFAREFGIPTVATWPKQSRDYKKYDTPAMRAEAVKYKILEDFVDLTRQVYDQNLTFKQLMTLLLSRTPCQVDFNWWSHSVCALDPVMIEPGSFGIRIWNSWTDSWSDNGMGVLRGNKAIPNGAVATRVVGPALIAT